MLVYILSNTYKTLGIFLSIFEAQKYYYENVSDLNVKLEEFTLNENDSKDMSIFLIQSLLGENTDSKDKYKNVSRFEPHHVFYPEYSSEITSYKCNTCDKEDCNEKHCN